MTTAILGYGTKVAISNDVTPETFFELVEVTEVVPPNEEVDDVEVTHMQSPGRTREYIAGLIEGGEASVTMNRVPNSATEVLILGLKTSGERRNIKITWPNAVVWTFTGHIKGYETESPIDGGMKATVTIKVDSNTSITP